MTSEGNGVFISLRDVYDQLVRLNNEIAGLSSKVDSARTVMDDHEDRLRRVEQWKYAIPATVVATTVMVAVELIPLVGN
ncbi:hypothetical protein [Thermomonospora umbrina]|uniref:Uncharacterized protein n=1 Tax=Thermomonospora umbrina TaxID=111806 RepID=A0A3D9SL71_9ACTN|nr:hypothetical protein [Thermomonospora umbrina]REE95150.1 hypothetical protein DFJ69_0532 [Thermomonospora umbrina]